MITLVDYQAGNLTSVRWALREVGVDTVITSDPEAVAGAERLIFPGVGAAGAAMENLRRLHLDAAVRGFVATGRPFLGICIGCQVILDQSDEDGGTVCLGLLPGRVHRFAALPGVKVPHMGWNQVRQLRNHPLLAGLPDGAEFYFVHSYYPAPADASFALGTTEYAGTVFPALLAKGNLAACQFHVEKSGPYGLRLLRNFSAWNGEPL